MIFLYSSSVNARRVSERIAPREAAARAIRAAVSSSGASLTTTAVVLAHNEVKVVDLASHLFEEIFGAFQSGWAFLDLLGALLCPAKECDVSRHWGISFLCKGALSKARVD